MDTWLNKLIDECYHAEIENEIPDKLELLEKFREKKVSDTSFLKDVTILFIQHHLYPIIGRLQTMKKNGMDPKLSWFIDIPYSTNEQVKERIKKEFTANDYPEPYTNPKENYAKFQVGRTKKVIKEIIDSSPAKVLVIDDGGNFIRAIYNLHLTEPELAEKLYNKVYLIEQTTKGHRFLEDTKYSAMIKKLNIPIVSIARSRTKLELESPFIGVACRTTIESNKRIQDKINAFKTPDKRDIKVAIIGYGAIGEAVFRSLKKMIGTSSNIDIIETDINKWQKITSERANPLAELSDSGYDIILGCTGHSSFSWNDRNKVYQEGLLISVSSAAIEFSRSNYIEHAELYPDDPIEIEIEPPSKGIHSDLRFKDSNNSFLFVNAGFPVNFTGERECLPLKFIQHTHTLLYAAAYQVLTEPKYGLQKLKEEYDNWIYYNSFIH